LGKKRDCGGKKLKKKNKNYERTGGIEGRVWGHPKTKREDPLKLLKVAVGGGGGAHLPERR